MLRAHQLRCAALIGGYARTAEAQALVRSGWAHDLMAPRPVVRLRAPRVVALEDSGYAQERDPAARTARLPSMALDAARTALDGRRAGAGAGAAARLRACAGVCPMPDHRTVQALHRPAVAARPRRSVRCAGGAAARSWRCGARGAVPTRCAPSWSAPAAPPRNSGRAFPGVTVITSGGDAVVATVPQRPPSSSRHPASSRPRPAATARRCCWTAGHCWAGRTCAPPRTRCGAGWRPPRWSAAAPTAASSWSSRNRRYPPCRR